MIGNLDARIEGVNEGIHRVLWTAKVVWEEDVAGIISVFTMANLQLPPCKVGLFFEKGVETHVLMKLKNSDVPPQDGPLHTGSHNLSSGTLKDDWQDLLKVATKNNVKTTKGLLRVAQIPKGATNCVHDVTMLH